jgi:multidrug efflux pump subunit AcrB
MIFSKVTFNLFPDSKDTNQLSVSISFPAGTTITQAEAITDRADKVVAEVLGDNFERATYFGNASDQNATSMIDIRSYEEREVTAKELEQQLQSKFNDDFKDAKVKVAQVSVGPPASAFVTQIKTENREAGFRLANDIAAYMQSAELMRPSGTSARFKNVSVSNPGEYIRSNGTLSIQVKGDFDGTDTTTLVTLAQDAIKKEFNDKKIASYSLPSEALSFDIGQESDNQESFKTLVLAFPILLFVIYILLATQFRSLLQPLLIFMAIPFSLFGVTLSLYLTDNAFSFFVAMGFFALIGLSIKNTILLTDYANQSRRAGMGAIDAAVEALSERFRPLIATSLTAVVSLIPLAVTSPFWQGLAVVLMGGLLSSTLLVVTVFPYYYLGGEFLRMHINRKTGLGWVALTILLTVVYVAILGMNSGLAILLAPVVATLIVWLIKRLLKKK